MIRFLIFFIIFGFSTLAQAADANTIPIKALEAIQGNVFGTDMSTSIRVFIFLTILTFIPAILLSMTCFTRILIVLSFARQALGTQTIPPPQTILGLSLFLSFYIMSPTLENVHKDALKPFLEGEMSHTVAVENGMGHMRKFILSNIREKDVETMLTLANKPAPKSYKDIPNSVLIPAFILSELKTAFQMGFLIFIPFLLLDLVTSSILMSMGMMMLPPVIISLPLKLILFVLVDGWTLITQSLLKSFVF